MIGNKAVLRTMMRESDGHYAGGLVNGARILHFFGDVATELMVRVDGDISLFAGYKNVRFTAPVYVGDFMEYHAYIEKMGKTSYTLKLEAYKVITMAEHVEGNEGLEHTAACVLQPPVLCGEATGTLVIPKHCQRGPQDPAFKDAVHQ